MKLAEGRAGGGAVVEGQENVGLVTLQGPKDSDDLGFGIRIGGAEIGGGAQEGISRRSWRNDLVASLETRRLSERKL